MRSLVTFLTLVGLLGCAHAKVPPRSNATAIALIASGGFATVVGAILVGYGYTLRTGPQCPASPIQADVCEPIASDYRAAGWSLFGIGIGVSTAGGILLGVQARN